MRYLHSAMKCEATQPNNCGMYAFIILTTFYAVMFILMYLVMSLTFPGYKSSLQVIEAWINRI
jgi:hypothetical protein